MILQGSQRAGARDLALHLLKDENEHVEIHELQGFVSDDLVSALNEAYAVSKGTKAKQYLFSLSLNPPPEEQVTTKDFEQAIAQVEERLDLKGQPRAIVFHEKDGRRHCHAVWSRIDADAMKAIPLPHTKRKLMDISRELYVRHGWQMPRGMVRSEERDPKNFTLAQWQQAKRTGKDPRAIKRVLQECWAVSDGQKAFASALESRGYILARGDRRGFVVLDQKCEPYAVSKWVGIKAKEVRAKLTKPEKLPSVQEAKDEIAKAMMVQLETLKDTQSSAIEARAALIGSQKDQLTRQHRQARAKLDQAQEVRRASEIRARQARFRRGLSGLWDRMTGKHRRIKEQNEAETHRALLRDRAAKDRLIFAQLKERQSLEGRHQRLAAFQERSSKKLSRDIDQYRDIKAQKRDAFDVRDGREKDGPTVER